MEDSLANYTVILSKYLPTSSKGNLHVSYRQPEAADHEDD